MLSDTMIGKRAYHLLPVILKYGAGKKQILTGPIVFHIKSHGWIPGLLLPSLPRYILIKHKSHNLLSELTTFTVTFLALYAKTG